MSFKKFTGIVTAFVMSFLFLFGVVLYTLVINNQTVAVASEIDSTDNPTVIDKIAKNLGLSKSSMNILVLGIDRVAANSDTIMVFNINPIDNKVNVLSVPRDTKVSIKGNTNKINAAYVFGGPELAMDSVSALLGIPIHDYVIVDTKAFREIIDILGGVRFNVPMNMNYEDPLQNLYIHLKKGDQILDGNKAEQFVRYRDGYINGDLGRVEAQKEFLSALLTQKLKPQYLLKTNDIIETVFEYLETNIGIDDSIKYIANLKSIKLDSINFHTLPGFDRKENLWYFICDKRQTDTLVSESFSSAGKLNVKWNGITEITPNSHQKPVDSGSSTGDTTKDNNIVNIIPEP